MKRLILATLSLSGLLPGMLIADTLSDHSNSLDQVLQQVQQSRQQDSLKNRQREAAFVQQKALQKERLQQANATLKALHKTSNELEQKFNLQQKQLQDKRQLLQQRMGDLKELFGHLTATAGDFRSSLQTSIISAQYPGREQALDALIEKMQHASLLPEVTEIEGLWFEILREMTESSKVVAFQSDVTTPDGRTSTQQVVRIGSFNLVSADKYLGYSAASGVLVKPSTRSPLYRRPG